MSYFLDVSMKLPVYEDYKKLTEHGFSSTASIYRCLRNLFPEPVGDIFGDLYESQLKSDSE